MTKCISEGCPEIGTHQIEYYDMDDEVQEPTYYGPLCDDCAPGTLAAIQNTPKIGERAVAYRVGPDEGVSDLIEETEVLLLRPRVAMLEHLVAMMVVRNDGPIEFTVDEMTAAAEIGIVFDAPQDGGECLVRLRRRDEAPQ